MSTFLEKRQVKATMTKEEARLFAVRWRLVNEATNEEVRRMTPTLKLHQLGVMVSAYRSLFKRNEALVDNEQQQVRERWRRLREKLNG